MAITTAPLLSFDARGAIAKTQVYSSWKGRQYARRYVVPSNPNTSAQQLTRNTFAWLQNAWKYMPGDVVLAWDAYARTSRFTAINGFIKQNLASLRSQTDLANFLFSPAANGGIAAGGATFTPGATKVTVAVTAPTLPNGWTISKAIGAAIADQDPQTEALYVVSSSNDATAPYSFDITGLTTAQLYECGAWFEYTKADGTLAYGQATMGTATPT